MGNKILGIIVAVAVIIIAGGLILANSNKNKVDNTAQDQMMDDQKMDDDSLMDDDKMMEEGDSMMEDDDAMMDSPGAYKDYSPSVVEAEQAAGNKVVLFFHAPWCPICQAANSAFNSRLDEVPSGVTVLKTDYDSNSELKKKYGVTYQHTFVQIDEQENLITKWNGGDIDNLIKYLQ